MRVLYIDTYFLLNLVLNYFLLLATAKLCAAAFRRRRLVLGAAFGGAYAAAAALPPLAVLAHPALKLASGAVLLLLAFGPARRFARLALVFFAVSAAAAGAALAGGLLGGDVLARLDLRVLAVSFALCYAVLTLVLRRVARRTERCAALVLSHHGRSLTLRCLVDTGSSLRDPVSGDPVAVVPLAELLPLFPREQRARVRASLTWEARCPSPEADPSLRLRLIPYTTVGGDSLLPAFRPDSALVDGKPRPLLIAAAPSELSDNGTYNAILPVDFE